MLGVGVVGAGWVSGEHIKAFEENPHTKVVAITSRRETSARQRMEEHNLSCNLYTDYNKMLEQDDIDIITICTPNHLHAEETIQAAEAGKHILIEKPVALNLEDLKRMRDAVREAKVKTVVGFVLRWNPFFQTAKSLIKGGALGEIFYAECDYLHRIGDWYSGWEWVTKAFSGGSSFLAAGCHSIDALRWFVGEEVTEVSAYSGRYNDDYEYDATCVAIMKFESSAIGKSCTSFDCNMPYVFNVELFGKKGTIRNDKLYCDMMAGQTDFANIPTILPDSGDVTHHPFQGEIDHLVECILKDKESHVNLEDGVKTHEVCIAADLSAERNEPVKLPLL